MPDKGISLGSPGWPHTPRIFCGRQLNPFWPRSKPEAQGAAEEAVSGGTWRTFEIHMSQRAMVMPVATCRSCTNLHMTTQTHTELQDRSHALCLCYLSSAAIGRVIKGAPPPWPTALRSTPLRTTPFDPQVIFARLSWWSIGPTLQNQCQLLTLH